MAYINTATNQYPLSERQIREALPQVSFTAPFTAPAPYIIVFPSPAPGFDSDNEYIEEGFPVDIDGQFYQTWEVKSKWSSQEEADAAFQIAQRFPQSAPYQRHALPAGRGWQRD